MRGLSDWKSDDTSPFFNYKLLRRQVRFMRKYRAENDVVSLMGVLKVRICTCISVTFVTYRDTSPLTILIHLLFSSYVLLLLLFMFFLGMHAF